MWWDSSTRLKVEKQIEFCFFSFFILVIQKSHFLFMYTCEYVLHYFPLLQSRNVNRFFCKLLRLNTMTHSIYSIDWWQYPCLDSIFTQFGKALFFHRGMTSVITQTLSLCGKHLLFWLRTIQSAVNFLQFLSLSPSLSVFSLPLPVWCDWSVFCHGALKPLLGVETPAACCLILENAAIKTLLLAITLLPPSRHLQQQYWLWIFNAAPCVKDLQRSLQHAWKGKTKLVWTTGGQKCYYSPAMQL